jgi:hypothetical protein
MSNPKCKGCGKIVYPVELIKALDAVWHIPCLKCQVCKTRLNLNNLQSFDKMPYCRTHVPKVVATTIADDVSTMDNKKSQELNAYSLRTNVATCKGTGEKPTSVTDDVMSQHAKDAQAKASYAKAENIGTQKGTGENPVGSTGTF